MEERKCFLCGRNDPSDPLEHHHIFGAAYRKKSEKYGLVVYLCGNRCHRNGRGAVHRNGDQMRRLRRYGQLKAREFGCYRLGARIWDLRHAGHAISKRTVTNKNRYGESVSFAEYRLEDKKC